jgi:sugar lactone lactonase YvrE
MKNFLIVILMLSAIAGTAQSDSLYYYYNQAKAAHENKDEALYYRMIKQSYKLHPYHPSVLYHLAMAASVNDDDSEAIEYLRKAVHTNADINLDRPEFDKIKSSEGFLQIKKLKDDLLVPIVQSDTAFVIEDKTLHIESIAAGEKPNTFYCGSIHKKKIIRTDGKGNFSDFTTSGEYGLTSVFGLKVDKTKNLLWACSSPMEEMENYDSTSMSGVFKFDLKTGKLIAKFIPEPNFKSFVFGDLTLDKSGNVFVSDSKNNIIFRINESTWKFEPFFTSTEFWNLQGITFSEDGQFLFIADYIKGLYRLEVKSKSLLRLKTDFDVSVKSIDGLTFYKNSLIAIQNSIYPMRVTQYFLNSKSDGLKGYRIIDRKHPAFNEPTIGTADGDSFFYVANSLWSGYDDQHSLKPDDQLQNVVILKSELKNKK